VGETRLDPKKYSEKKQYPENTAGVSISVLLQIKYFGSIF
jgi:hypothetical protein